MAPIRICANCGTIGKVKTHTQGSFLIEVVLWLFFLLPGLIYSIWRLTTRKEVCAACGSPNRVPINTPRGKQLAESFGYVVTDSQK